MPQLPGHGVAAALGLAEHQELAAVHLPCPDSLICGEGSQPWSRREGRARNLKTQEQGYCQSAGGVRVWHNQPN